MLVPPHQCVIYGLDPFFDTHSIVMLIFKSASPDMVTPSTLPDIYVLDPFFDVNSEYV